MDMDSQDKQDVQLTEENLKNICRLCLRIDDEITISIFDRPDPNPKKRPLAERIQELYQINVRQ